jgi:hypothetical protein
MASGNLSFLNLLTIVLAFPLIDGGYFAFLHIRAPQLAEPHTAFKAAVVMIALLVAVLSINPIRNMMSARQVMNTTFNTLHLVGTYGAFGGVTRERYEVIVEGTNDPDYRTAQWKEYEFKGKPGDVSRIPPQIAPYHLRLDWLMWFAAMGQYYQYPWFVHFTAKLLEGDPATLSLLHSNPFPDHPPKYIRAQLYRYNFTSPDERRKTGHWWKREFAGGWFPIVSLDEPDFQRVLRSQGWLD